MFLWRRWAPQKSNSGVGSGNASNLKAFMQAASAVHASTRVVEIDAEERILPFRDAFDALD